MRISKHLPSFHDELQKISGTGTYVRELGAKAARGAGKHAVQAGENVGNTLVAMANPRKALREGWDATFKPGGKPVGTGYKLFMGGTAAIGLHGALSKNDPMNLGRSRVRRTTQFIGDQMGGLMGAPFGLAGGITGSMIGGKVGDTAGRVIDRARRYRPKTMQPPNLPPRPQGLNEGG